MTTATVAMAGYSGTVNSSGDDIKKWNCDLEVELLDATHMAGLGWKQNVYGLKGGKGNIGVQKPLSLWLTSSSLTLYNGTVTLAGLAKFSKAGVDDPVEGMNMYSYDYVFDGSITITGGM